MTDEGQHNVDAKNHCVYVWLYNGTFSPVILVLFLVLLSLFCATQIKYTILLLFSKTLHYSRKKKSFSRVLISNTRNNMHFTRFLVWPIRSPFQAFGPLLKRTSYPIITRTYQASFLDIVYKPVRGALTQWGGGGGGGYSNIFIHT